MRGIFRITSAEFNKIFKKPTVYIMAFVLVFACLISLFTFNPTPRKDDKVSLSNKSAESNYSEFISSTGSDTKTTFDKTINDSNSIVDKYKNNYDFVVNIDTLEKQIITSLGILETYNPSDTKIVIADEIDKIKNGVSTLSTYLNRDDDYYKNLGYFQTALSIKSLKNDTSYLLSEQAKIEAINTSITGIDDYEILINSFKNNDYIKTISQVCDVYKNYVRFVLDSIVDELKEQDKLYKSYLIKIVGVTNPAVTTEEELRVLDNIVAKLAEYKQLSNEIVTKDSRLALISKQNKIKLDIIIKRVTSIVSLNNYDRSQKTKRQEVATKLNNDNYINQLYAYNKLLTFIDYKDKSTLDKLLKLKDYQTKNQTELTKKIESLKNDTSTTRINENITSYKLMSESYKNVVNNIFTRHITKTLTNKEIKNLNDYDLSSYNKYNLDTSIMYDTYYLENNVYSNSYLNNFNYNQSVDYEKTAYDYIFSTLKICTLLIIIFTMMMSAYLISSECDSGTIKLLLMRPYTRGKILSAKMLATLFFSLCFMLLSIIITVVGGLATFGLPAMTKMLVVFNSSFIFETSPIIMLLVYVLTAILDIIFYLIIAYFVSILFKSFAGSISTSFIIILLSIVLSLSLSSSIVYAFIPFTNVSWFRYFGLQSKGSASSLFDAIFSTPVQSSMNFWISLVISALTCAVLYLVTYITFKKRDY